VMLENMVFNGIFTGRW